MSYMKSVCNVGCTKAGACCHGNIVPVTDADVRRLMQATGLPAAAIVRLYSVTDLDYDGDRSWIRFSYGRRLLGLKKRGEACRFLNQYGLCTVYNSRPMTCRTFPYMVYFDANGRPEPLQRNTASGCCARVGPAWPRKQLLTDARQEDAEDARFFSQLRRWEKRGSRGGKRGLLRFLGLV